MQAVPESALLSEPHLLFERIEETHLQKAYQTDTVIALLEEAGMEFVAVYGAGTRKAPEPDCERIYFIAREKHQEQKYYGAGQEVAPLPQIPPLYKS